MSGIPAMSKQSIISGFVNQGIGCQLLHDPENHLVFNATI